LAVARRLYPTREDAATIAGVEVHTVRPLGAPSGKAGPRPVLICLHGGAFMWGEGPGALLEAVPVASVSGMEVIAIEYRMAPEHRFPAATEDVLAVYRALRADETVGSIGMFGCSAGAALTAQTTARLIADGDPLPDAIAMLHAAGLNIGGDSAATAAELNGAPEEDFAPDLAAMPYFAGTDPTDPLAFPGEHPEVLALFPPSLLISSTRDFAASSVTVMHRRLLAAGAQADLVIFDGLWHAHHVTTDQPESRETFELLARFFNRLLA
jgi:acetyl esterase/lipase